MNKVALWSITPDTRGNRTVINVPVVQTTETERLLEDLLVGSPQLLMDGLTLIGRQNRTEGGPLDLLGIDDDGNLVVFELKRGSLSRDAVAQVVDYVSDIVEKGLESLARLIKDRSGLKGIDRIEDFQDWYSENYPDKESCLEETPRMVLVGLGADKRTVRMVNFLAKSGLPISLVTFNAFETSGSLFLARQIETSDFNEPAPLIRSNTQSKEANERALLEYAKKLGVEDLLRMVAEDLAARFDDFYRWSAKRGYSFCLTEQTDRGTLTQRVYFKLSPNPQQRGTVTLSLLPRALTLLGTVEGLSVGEHDREVLDAHHNGSSILVSSENWSAISPQVAGLLRRLLEKRKEKLPEPPDDRESPADTDDQ